MKTLVIFYSYTGHSKAIASEFAAKESADILEIKDVNRPGMFKAYTSGAFSSMRGRACPIMPFEKDFAEYDRLVLFSPVWAGNVPPAVNAVLESLPEGKTISVKLVSASGKSSCIERLETIIKTKGGTLESFEDISA